MQKLVRSLSATFNGHPVFYRPGTTDRESIKEMLVSQDYDCLGPHAGEPALIVDGGSYAGYSVLFFLSKYRKAHVIAIEPDPGNFELCALNLEPYRERVTLIHAAIWPAKTRLALRRNAFADGEWAVTVEEAQSDEDEIVQSITLDEILELTGRDTIDLLKMCVNLSARHIFLRNYSGWLSRVRNMIVQLDSEQGEDAFLAALTPYRFYLAKTPGLWTCTELAPAESPAPRGALPSPYGELANPSFEELRVAPPRLAHKHWIPGSTELAAAWQVAVNDPQFYVSLAVRSAAERTGEIALRVSTDPALPLPAKSAPYAAIENVRPIQVQEGERWQIGVFARTRGGRLPEGVSRGAFAFLRIRYDDDSFVDLGTQALSDGVDDSRELTAVVEVPATPAGRVIARATFWLYAWLNNATDAPISPAESLWEVIFDDAGCSRI